MSEKQKDYFSSREAAERLGVAVSTIQLWTNNGLLRAWTTGGGHRRIARSSVDEMLSQRQAAVAGKQALPQQLSVVIVEDNAQQLRMYKKQFSTWKLDVNVVTASDGYQGLIQIGRILPDVIITDLVMPELDGFQMVRALKGQKTQSEKKQSELEHSLVIVVTGLTDDEIGYRGGLPEDVHVFTKPVPFLMLENLIRKRAEMKAAAPTLENLQSLCNQ